MKNFVFAALLLTSTSLTAAHAGVGVDATIGTTGISGHVRADVLPILSLRAGINYLAYDFGEQDFDGNTYDAELDFTQFGLYADLHPFSNGFTVTGGYLFGDRNLELTSVSTTEIDIGGEFFTAEEVGDLSGTGTLGDGGFYAGIGWDNITRGTGRVRLIARLGVIISDEPSVALESVGGTLSNDPILLSAIEGEIADINDDISDYRFFPVVQVGIGVRF
ncbi:MAG: hypothetical protein AAGH41_02100 [Pseudomonadota bacterium]